MTVTRKHLAITLLVITVVVGGFFLGRTIRQPPDFIHLTLTDPAKPVLSGYQLVAPSIGPMIRTVPVYLRLEKYAASDTLSSEDARDIQKDQTVILYDHDDNVMTEPGQVIWIEPDDKTTKVMAKLPAYDHKWWERRIKGRVIVMETMMARRLPDSAVIMPEDGSPYVWKAEPQEDGNYKVVYTPVGLGLKGDGIIGVDYHIRADELVVLNPDDKLEDGAIIPATLREMIYADQTPIEMARNKELIENHKKSLIEARVEEMQAGTPCAMTASSLSLYGIDPDALDEEILKNMPSQLDVAPSAGSCGPAGAPGAVDNSSAGGSCGGGCGSCGTPATTDEVAAPVPTDVSAATSPAVANAPDAPAPSGQCNCGLVAP